MDRRAILAGAFAAPLLISSSSAAEDLRLIELGRTFEDELAKLIPIKRAGDALDRQFTAEAKRRRLNAKEWCAFREECGLEKLIREADEYFVRLDGIADQIASIPARTVAGLYVWIRAAAYQANFYDRFDAPEDDMDWDVLWIFRLLKEAARLAGLQGPNLQT